MQPNLFFFDYDGTLIEEDGPMTERTRNALYALQKAGHKIALCTGRCRGHVAQELWDLGFDGMVISCGADIQKGDERIFYMPFAHDFLMEFLRTCEKVHRRGCMEGQKRIPFYEPDYAEADYPGIRTAEEMDTKFPGVTVEKFTLMGTKLEPELAKLAEKENLFTIYQTAGDYMELIRNDIDKGTGIRRLAESMGIPMERTYGFGDSANDRPMLETVHHSVVVGNAAPSVQAMATEVAERAENDGVARWIENYLANN